MLILKAQPLRKRGLHRMRALGGFALLVGAVGCSSGEAGTGTASTDTPGDGDSPDVAESIRFEPTSTLTLAPREVASLTVQVAPALRQTVRFELLTDQPDFDGFLLEATAQVRDDGSATVKLEAPSIPSTFVLRASLSEQVAAVRAISVSSQGYGELRVEPAYEGTREVGQWTASARAGISCDELASFWADGPLVATGSSVATISSVPSGPPIAVTVRGGQLVSGCTTVIGLDPDEVMDLVVEATDRPIDVTTGTFELRLGVDSTATEFAAHLDEAISKGTTAFLDDSATEGAALLEAMGTLLSAEAAAEFETAIATYALVDVVDVLYQDQSPISSFLLLTLTEAAGTIFGDDVFVGELTLHERSSQFLLTEAAGVPASMSGFFQSSTWSVSAEPGDTIVLGGSLGFEPLRWLVAIAEHNQIQENSPETLTAEAGECNEVASALIMAAGGPTHSNCDEICLVDLCENALRDVWRDLQLAGNGLSTLQIGMSGPAELIGAAQLGSIDGSWIGGLAGGATSLKGPASATLISPE